MKYTRPEMEYIRFEDVDILTESNELPIMHVDLEEPESFSEPADPSGD